MKEFSFGTRIYFGIGALERLSRVRNRRVLIITDAFMESSGVADKVASYLQDDCTVTVFSDVVPDPPIETVAKGVECLKQSSAEVIIAVGGGSVIDAAKAIRSLASKLLSSSYDISECFAIPTTSGTGSEVTDYAVITDAEKGIKYPMVSSTLRPQTAILDPTLVLSAPPSITAESGMDVLTHSLETFVSTDASDFSDALAEKATSLVFRFLPIAYRNGKNMAARERMHNASCMAGMAFNSAGLGLCHGISHALGGKLHLPHGKLNAMILPHIIEYNALIEENGEPSLTVKKYQRLARVLRLPSDTPNEAVGELIEAVKNLNRELDIPETLKEAGADMGRYEMMFDDIVRDALADATTVNNPRSVSKQDVEQILVKLAGI